jgi:cysteine desulfurase
MGRSVDEAHCAVRLSLSNATTDQDIDDTIAALGRVLEELETTIRFLPCK